MCNQDYRYVAILTLLIAMSIGMSIKKIPYIAKYVISIIVLVFSFSAMIMWWWIAL